MDDEEKLRAIESRDGSYDWRFWYGVKSTGIVCRPSCSARVPARKNIVLFDTLEDAIRGGFRPCKVCLRELYPPRRRGFVSTGRCAWCEENELLRRYHDEGWCTERHDDESHYEHLVLEVMQCGLSWDLMLGKREIFRRCFAGFDCRKVAEFDDSDVERILAEDGMIRSERKVRAVIGNSKVFLAIVAEFGLFDSYIRSFVDNKVLVFYGKQPAESEASRRLSADLKRRGAKFLGRVVLHSHLESFGIVMEHEPGCRKFQEFMAALPENVAFVRGTGPY